MAKSVAKACGSPWRGTMVSCRSMSTTVCFVKKYRKKKKTGSPTSGKTKTKDKINILRDNVLEDRGLNVMPKTKIRLTTKATIVGEI